MTLGPSLGRIRRGATSESFGACLLTPATKAGRNLSACSASGLTHTVPQSDNWHLEAPEGSSSETVLVQITCHKQLSWWN